MQTAAILCSVPRYPVQLVIIAVGVDLCDYMGYIEHGT